MLPPQRILSALSLTLPSSSSSALVSGTFFFFLRSSSTLPRSFSSSISLSHSTMPYGQGTYANEWAKWEKQLRDVLFGNSEYLNSVQVPFESAVKEVSEELSKIAKGEYKTPEYRTPDSGKRKIGAIVFAAISLPVTEIKGLLDNLAGKDGKVAAFLKDKDLENKISKAHVTLAHKRSHGVTAVANYGIFLQKQVPVDITALLFTDKMAAFEACPVMKF